jgi:hypothetical protein
MRLAHLFLFLLSISIPSFAEECVIDICVGDFVYHKRTHEVPRVYKIEGEEIFLNFGQGSIGSSYYDNLIVDVNELDGFNKNEIFLFKGSSLVELIHVFRNRTVQLKHLNSTSKISILFPFETISRPIEELEGFRVGLSVVDRLNGQSGIVKYLFENGTAIYEIDDRDRLILRKINHLILSSIRQ